MRFMNAYKRLDNLCRDMNGIGVTGYIEGMEQTPNGDYYVSGWNDDYRRLKHYRHIRNQIAHENYADEENMCSDEDEIWIESFYRRIITQNDPLALHYKAPKPLSVKAKASRNCRTSPSRSDIKKPSQKIQYVQS